jgi:diacylglycerol O-acyltransferase
MIITGLSFGFHWFVKNFLKMTPLSGLDTMYALQDSEFNKNMITNFTVFETKDIDQIRETFIERSIKRYNRMR